MAKLFTPEQHKHFVRYNKGRSAKKMAELMNKKFGLNITATQVKAYRGNHGLSSGLTGQFKKGQKAWNLGMKLPGNGGYTTFKKGNMPPNYVPIGTFTYTTDGYPKIKVADPNVWEYCHHQEWIRHNGPIPEGHSILFLDGDKTNWDISNLACVSRSELIHMSRHRLYTSDAELTKAGVGIAKIHSKLKEIKTNGTQTLRR